MRGENVLEIVRARSQVHVVEESRHMRFARQEIREHMDGAGGVKRAARASVIAAIATLVVRNPVNPGVYRVAGLAPERACGGGEQRAPQVGVAHFLRGLVEFLAEAGFLMRPTGAAPACRHALSSRVARGRPHARWACSACE
ncbi:diiron oxygenase [Salinifilum ghardaiensis]